MSASPGIAPLTAAPYATPIGPGPTARGPVSRGRGALDGARAIDAIAPPSPVAGRAPGIVWEGPQWPAHSFALSNREFCLRLAARGHDLTILPAGSRGEAGGPVGPHPSLAPHVREGAARADVVHVRHQWPPSFEPPPAGHWVVMQPWEFGSIPAAWVGPMTRLVDEVWAYTTWVRDCYVASGVPADRVHVVPLGVDPDVFRPQAPAMPLPTAKRFKFLFVGGTIHRKGPDALLNAYAAEFTAADDVCLVIQDFGTGSFYRGQTAGPAIDRLRATPGAPEVLYQDRTLAWPELAGLYRACDCLVHPYRGEGFGLPIAEAMACGTPAIVTGYGAAMDFCGADDSYPVLARVPRFAEKRVGEIATADHPWLAEPDPASLRERMRHAYENPDEARRKGDMASVRIRGRFTWAHAADAVERRLEALAGRPVRRLTGAG